MVVAKREAMEMDYSNIQRLKKDSQDQEIRLVDFLSTIINTIKKHENSSDLSMAQPLKEQYNAYLNDINKLIPILRQAENLTDDEQNLAKRIIETLEVFNEGSVISLTAEQITTIRNNSLVLKVISVLKGKINKYEHNVANDETAKEEIQILNDFIHKICDASENDDYFYDSDSLHKFLGSMKSYHVSDRQKLYIQELIMKFNLSTTILNNSLEDDLNTEVKKIVKYNLSVDDLTQIFAKFGYDFSKVKPLLKEKIRMYGNRDTIESVFTFFKKYKINYKETNNKLNYVLYKTSIDILEDLEKNVTDPVYLHKYGYDTSDSLNSPEMIIRHEVEKMTGSLFTTTKKITRKPKISGPRMPGNHEEVICGSHEDSEKNKELASALGYNVALEEIKCPSFFSASNERIKRNVQAMQKMYGVDFKQINESFKLTGLLSPYILQTMDRFIELDELDYALQNTSRLCYPPDDNRFYRLYKAKKEGIPYFTTFHAPAKGGIECKAYLNRITLDKDQSLGINEDNKITASGVYLPSIFDLSIEQKMNADINSLDYIDLANANMNEITLLDNTFQHTDLAYTIDDVIISRVKVIRIFSMLKEHFGYLNINKLILYSVIYNTFLTEEQFKIIKDQILQLNFGMEKEKEWKTS
jgi:hypothetical protein